MNNKASIKDSFVIILIATTMLSLIFIMILDNGSDAGVIQDPRLNDTYTNYIAQQNEINETLSDMRSSIDKLDEAKFGDLAFFGLKGLLFVMLAPIKVITTGVTVFSDTAGLFDFVPPIVTTAIVLIIIAVLLFSFVKFVTSRGNEP